MVKIKKCETPNELEQIYHLQKKNLAKSLNESDRIKEGFVTADHSIDLLRRMNTEYQHIIAVDGGKVIGYALVMLMSFKDELEILKPMFLEISKSKFNGTPLNNLNFFIMGQVCIEKEYRGKGLFSEIYEFMKEKMKTDFDAVVTEVLEQNKRSIRAHEKIGFEVFKVYESPEGEKWSLIIWDWR